jgi:LacI family transcriptional regulator
MLEAGGRLIALGHRQILFIVRHATLSITQSRMEGLQAAIRQTAENVTVKVLECGGDEESSFLARLGPELGGAPHPTAIIVSNSALASWTFRALRALGIVVPDQISLLAIDEPEWADLVQPTLSVIRTPTRAIAFMAWEVLTQRIEDRSREAQHVELKAEVLFRQSIAPPARKRVVRAATPAE